MIAPGSGLRIVVACHPVDFRKGVNGLAALVAEALRADPYCGDVFVFRARRSDRVKILAWDGSGMVLATKWLEEGRFTWPAVRDGTLVLSPAQFALLFAGLDWTRVVQRAVRRPLKAA